MEPWLYMEQRNPMSHQKSRYSRALKGALIGWLVTTIIIAILGFALLLYEKAHSGYDMAGMAGMAIILFSPFVGIIGAIVGALVGAIPLK